MVIKEILQQLSLTINVNYWTNTEVNLMKLIRWHETTEFTNQPYKVILVGIY